MLGLDEKTLNLTYEVAFANIAESFKSDMKQIDGDIEEIMGIHRSEMPSLRRASFAIP